MFKKVSLTVFALFVICMASALVSASSFVPVLDQSQENSNAAIWVSSTRTLCQTFTAGMTGNLTMVSILLTGVPAGELYPATISIVELTSGIPDGTKILWSNSYETLGWSEETDGWYDMDMSISAPFLTSGVSYGIKFCTDDDDLPADGHDDYWRLQRATNPYSDGNLWQNKNDGSGWVTATINGTADINADAAFRTYITVPEPVSITMFLSGLTILVRRRKIFS